MENTPGRINALPSDTAATGEEVRALVTALWALAAKLDRVLSMFDRQADDPRYKSDLYKPRY